MRSLLKVLLIIALAALIPFLYFYYRDVMSSSTLIELESCAPYNVEWEPSDEDLRVKWLTRGECVGYIRYAQNSDSAGSIAVDVNGSGKKKSHEVNIPDVEDGGDYYITFYSGEKTYGQAGRPIVITLD